MKMHFHYFVIISLLSKVNINIYSTSLLMGQVENDPTVQKYCNICIDREKGYKDHLIKGEMRLRPSKHVSFILIVI